MPQVHLSPEVIARIIHGGQRAIIYPIANDKFRVGKSISVREPWCLLDGKLIYRADQPNWVGYEWKPSIHMREEMIRLHITPHIMEQVRIADITDDEVIKLGYRDRMIMEREWNLSLTKKKRPILGAKFNPLIWYMEFDIKVLDKE
jgi:hypothetical protein